MRNGPDPGGPGPLVARRLDVAVDTERTFLASFAASPYAFWLDSSRVDGPARYSFLGEADELLTGGFAALERRLAAERLAHSDLPPDLPGALACGYVGYFGYECDEESGGAWARAHRFVVVDHLADRTYVVARGDASWVDRTAARLRDPRMAVPVTSPGPGSAVDPEPWLVRDRERYLRDVRRCLELLRAGESYEICLTDTLVLPYTGDPLTTYRRLRRLEPAPYASYLRLGDRSVLSVSPERFLTVGTDRTAESRPIKGTLPRSADPVRDEALRKTLAADPKTRAENLMIVDLLRNDLGRVCEPGSIEVPTFLGVESYATVHQLVSTVRGRLRPEVTAVGAVRACFPPGSMTGAPKPRTMRILAELENRPRGVYSGALGWFGLCGNADLAVVIRSAVVEDGVATVGAGGAIVLDSDPGEEYAEMVLKAAVPLRALGEPPSRPEPAG